MSTADSESQSQVSRPILILLGVVVGGAALFALYTFVIGPLLGGDEDDLGQLPDPPTTLPTDGSTPDPDATDLPEDGTDDGTGDPADGTDFPDELLEGGVVPETFEIFTSRDPFQQLVVEADAATGTTTTGTTGSTADTTADANSGTGTTTGGTTTGGTTGGGTTGGTTDGGTTGGSTGGTTGGSTDGDMTGGSTSGDGTQATGGGETAPQAANVGSTTITLDDVFSDGATPRLLVTVNGTTTEVGEGEVFAQRFQLLDIDGLCATFLFGDSRFTLCEGETIVK